MTCPKCGSANVHVQIVQTGATTRTKGKGCLYSIFRFVLVVCTCGLWLLLGRKKVKSRTTYTTEKCAVCSSCGRSWTVK